MSRTKALKQHKIYKDVQDIKRRLENNLPTTFSERNILTIYEKKRKRKAGS